MGSMQIESATSQARAWRSPRRYDPCMADLNQIAHRIVRESTEPRPQETPAQISGRKGGQKGGAARAEKLSAEKRSEIARKAARARWRPKPDPA
jgi:hypothetical protein